jgi:hypothetical protein
LKIDTGVTRYWLARTTTDDGEPYDHRVTIERLIEGRWIAVHTYPGDGRKPQPYRWALCYVEGPSARRRTRRVCQTGQTSRRGFP